MKTSTRALIAILLILCLVGCAQRPAETADPTDTAPAVTQATAPSTEKTEPSSPAAIPAEDTEPTSADSYDLYFSTIVPKETAAVAGIGAVLVDARSQYADTDVFVCDENRLPIYPQLSEENIGQVVLEKSGEITVLSSEKFLPRVLSFDDSSVLAVTENRQYLLRIPFDGSEPQVIYEDPYLKLEQAECFDKCIFFSAGASAEAMGIYRLYMPDGTLDLIADGILPASETGDDYGVDCSFTVISNCEVAWDVRASLLGAYGEACWEQAVIPTDDGDKTPKDYYGCSSLAELLSDRREAEDYIAKLDRWLYETQQVYSAERFYRNAMTGEMRHAYGFTGYDLDAVVYPDGTFRSSEEDHRNGELWWLDDYYTASQP